MKFTPTLEQQKIIDHCLTGKDLAVKAFAGTAKSTTLALVSHELHKQGKKGLYIAFNKSIAMEAKGKMASSVDCLTIHSLAYKNTEKKLLKKLQLPFINSTMIAERLNVSKVWYEVILMGERNKKLAKPESIIFLAKETIKKFCNSSDNIIQSHHVSLPDIGKARFSAGKKDIEIEVLKIAKRYWKEMVDSNSDVPITHDTYLKLFSMSAHKLNGYDYVMGDEWQDCNPCITIWFNEQPIQKIVVGDDHQCVSGDTMVDTDSGKKEMRYLEVGNKVKSFKNGVVCYKEVTKKSKSLENSGVQIETNGGKKLAMTKEHLIWAELGNLKNDQHIVYMMWRKGFGYRIGITNKLVTDGSSNFGQRTRSERAMKLWILDITETRNDALFLEVFYSINYSIPTRMYNASDRNRNQENANKLFNIFGENGINLLLDKKYSFDYPHWQVCNTPRSGSNSLTINMKAHTLKGTSISFEWGLDKPYVFDVLHTLGIVYTKAKKDNRYRLRKLFNSYVEALEFARSIQKLMPSCFIKESLGNANLIPASCLQKGMKVFVEDSGNVSREDIVNIQQYESDYYDIEVEDTANFFGNDILSHNCIYQWRGSINALESIDGIRVLNLTKTFRFGGTIADRANIILKYNGEKLPLVGNGNTADKEVEPKFYDCYIFRTNSSCLEHFSNLMESNDDLKVNLNIDVKDIMNFTNHWFALQDGNYPRVSHTQLIGFKSTEEVSTYLEENNDKDLERYVKLVNKFGKRLFYILKNVVDQNEADCIVTTCHKVKGLEFDSVYVGNDFDLINDSGAITDDDMLLNLAYVAVTRGKKYVNSDSINNFLNEINK